MSEAQHSDETRADGVGVSVTSHTSSTGHDWLGQVLEETLAAEGVSSGTVDLIMVDEEEMAHLNETHMGSSGPTDVLSFPMDAPGDDTIGGMAPHIGDIVLCSAVAERQAADHVGDPDSEVTLLVIHGALHLLGHDHYDPDESAAMLAREMVNLERYDIVHPSESGDR